MAVVANERISLVLDEKNYSMWRFVAKTTPTARGLFQYVESDVAPQPNNIAAHTKWKEEERITCALLVNSISPPFLVKIYHCEIAKAMWDALASKFQPLGVAASIYLCKLFSCEYVDGTSMETFLCKFSRLQDDFIASGNNLENDFFSYMIYVPSSILGVFCFKDFKQEMLET